MPMDNHSYSGTSKRHAGLIMALSIQLYKVCEAKNF